MKVLSCFSAPLSSLTPLLQHSHPLIVVASMEATLLPLATSKVVLISTKTTLLIEDEPTQVRVVDHLIAKYAEKRAIMLTAATNGMFDLILLMLTLLKPSTRPVLLLDLMLLIGFWMLGLRPI